MAGMCENVRWCSCWKGRRGGEGGLWEGDDLHIVPVRLRPRTMTSMRRVRTEERVSTSRGLGCRCWFCCGWAMVVSGGEWSGVVAGNV